MPVHTSAACSVLRQRYLFKRIGIALIAGTLCTLLSLLSSYQQLRQQAVHQQQKTVQQLRDYFDTLQPFSPHWQNRVLTFSNYPCEQVQPQLQQAATQDHNARSYLLVQQGQISCSSSAADEARMLQPHLNLLLQHPHTPMLLTEISGHEPVLVYWWPDRTHPKQGVLYVQDTYPLTHILLRPQPPYITGLSMAFSYPYTQTLHSIVPEDAPLGTPNVSWHDTEHQVTLHLYGPDGWQLLPLLNGMPMAFALLLGVCVFMLVLYLYSDRHHVSHDLHALIRRKKLHMHYQPLIDCQSGRCIGVEALLRSTSFDINQSPAAFIQQLEQHHLMPHLTHYLMQLIAQDMQRLPHDLLPSDFRVSVNISPDHFNEPALLENTRLLRQALPTQTRLILEITEHGPLHFHTHQMQQLDALQALPGVHLALDDFGTGHSTLSYLHQLHPDYLKIDQQFTASIDTPERDTVVLDSIIALAQRLDIALIAEGVENGVQAMYLRQKGVQTLQGFLFARPMRIEALQEWLQNSTQKFADSCPLSLESSH